jgi:peroxiredoxin
MGPKVVGLVLTAVITAVAASAQSAPAARFEAAKWLNTRVAPEAARGETILFFFSAKQSAQERSASEYVRLLNRLRRRPNTAVVGLTADPVEAAEKFIRRHHPRFPIGAASRSAARYGVRELPAVVVIKADAPGGARVSPAQLSELLPRWDGRPLTVEKNAEAWKLISFIEDGEQDWGARCHAVRKLYAALPAAEFVEYATERLAEEEEPWVRGRLEYFRDLARGIPRTDEQQSLSARAIFKDYPQNPDAPEWAPVREFEAKADSLTVEEKLAVYWHHGGTTAADTLVRRLVAESLKKVKEKERAAAREALLSIIAADPDHSIRMVSATGLGEICEVGDLEVASFLEELARTEPNVTLTRPVIEYTARHLRGIEIP